MRLPVACFLLCSLACSSAPRRGNTVIMASGADLQSANPLFTTHPLARQIQRYALLVTLVRYDSTMAFAPYLARAWEWSADRSTITFRIFHGLRWHDGAPTTARDAAWTLNAARDPGTGYPRQADLADLAMASAPDDTTLVLRFAGPRNALPDVLTDLALLPKHLLDTVPPDRLRQAGWNREPVGNGPFRFVAHEANRRWVFSANRDFPAELGGPPLLDRFVVAVVDEPTTKLAALTSGEIDLAGINPAHAEFVRRNPRLRVLDYPLLFSYMVILNTRRSPFDRLAPRQALAAAVDRRAVVDGVLFGFATPATGPLPPALAGVERPPGEAPPSRSPPGGPKQLPLRFELLTVGSGEAALEQLLQSQLAGSGITANIRQLELSTYLDRVEGPSHQFEAAVLGMAGDPGLGYLGRILSLSGLAAGGTTDEQLRRIADSLPAVFLYHARGVQGINRRIGGIRMDLRGELVTLPRWTVSGAR
ncbi:MAG TPA: ABC transporter substrate-binding protein [Gemmatimonadales bacterium]